MLLLCTCCSPASLIAGNNREIGMQATSVVSNNLTYTPHIAQQHQTIANNTASTIQASTPQAHHGWDFSSILWLLLQSVVAGLLAMFTPYMYTIHPFTSGYLTRNVKTRNGRIIKTLLYAVSLIIIFSLLGTLISGLIKLTGVNKFSEHWVFSLFFFRRLRQ